MAELGTKIVGGLTLEGTSHTTVFSGAGRQVVHSVELWAYRFPDPRILPIIMELRFEGSGEVVERRLDVVTTTQVPQSIFEIPADFTIGEPPR